MSRMRAVVTRPGAKGRVEMIDLERPTRRRDEVLIAMREVGVDGTDREVIEGAHGDTAPPGADYLILGHESLGQLAEIGAKANGLGEGDWVVCTVRRPDGCPNCRRGQIDSCLWGQYTERGIKGAHGYLAEYVTERPKFILPVPDEVRPVGALIEPLSINEKAILQAWRIQRRLYWQPETALVFGLGTIGILAAMLLKLRGLDVYLYSRSPADAPDARLLRQIGVRYISVADAPRAGDLRAVIPRIDLMIEATGAPAVVAEALTLMQPNSVLCLLSITGAAARLTLDIAAINQQIVLGNAVVFGSVNSSRPHFEQAIGDLTAFEHTWPGFTESLITRRVPFEQYREALTDRPGDIKVVIDIHAEIR